MIKVKTGQYWIDPRYMGQAKKEYLGVRIGDKSRDGFKMIWHRVTGEFCDGLVTWTEKEINTDLLPSEASEIKQILSKYD